VNSLRQAQGTPSTSSGNTFDRLRELSQALEDISQALEDISQALETISQALETISQALETISQETIHETVSASNNA